MLVYLAAAYIAYLIFGITLSTVLTMGASSMLKRRMPWSSRKSMSRPSKWCSLPLSGAGGEENLWIYKGNLVEQKGFEPSTPTLRT
jgi:hypothetical protein